MSARRGKAGGMSSLGPYQDPDVRAWFDALPNSDYWENCRRLGEESLARARAEHAAQRGD